MKRLGCLFFGLLLLADLTAFQREPDAIRLHGTMTSAGITVNLSVIAKAQHQIKATVSNSTKSVSIEVFFNEDGLHLHEQYADGTRQLKQLTGDLAASHLLDLLAVNPHYHFRDRNGFQTDGPACEGYRFVLVRANAPLEGTELYPIRSISIHKDGEAENPPLRTIRYLEFMESTEPYLQPKTMEFIDEVSGESGTIRIHKVEYNAGLPDFLFETPETGT